MVESFKLKLFQERPYLLTLGLLGVFLVIVGVFSVVAISDRGNNEAVVISKSEPATEKVIVDVAGAVLRPGVYQLEPDSRINDVLIQAGGLSQEADRDWVSQNLNLAQKLTDGTKLYIPSKDEVGQVAGSQTSSVSLNSKININTASSADLDRLWGVGPATAEKIIQNRPYGSVEELLTKKAVKSNVYEAIKDQVSVY